MARAGPTWTSSVPGPELPVPVPSVGLTTGALAVLAEISLTAAAALGKSDSVRAASLHLDTPGDWPTRPPEAREKPSASDPLAPLLLYTQAWAGDRHGSAHSRILPTRSATQVMSMDVTFVRSFPLDAEAEAAVTVRRVSRQLAVADSEIGTAGSRPSVLARFLDLLLIL
ncbi:hypothetical protein [Frankia sp. CcWB2]